MKNMRKLNESETEEIEALKHLIKYTIKKPEVTDLEIWRCITEMQKIHEKYLDVSEEQINEILDLPDYVASRMICMFFLMSFHLDCKKLYSD